MYILLAIIAATALGVAVHFLVRPREVRGAVLSGAIAAATSAVVYTAMTWAGVGEANIWTWLASILGAALVSAGATVAITRSRVASDARERARLGIG